MAPPLSALLIMKNFQIFTTVLLSVTNLSARQHPDGKLHEYHAQFISSPPLKLDDSSYIDVTASPRNHTSIVLLTALEARFGCQLCRDFQPEWEILARSSVKGGRGGTIDTIYGTLDFVDGKTTFSKVTMEV